MLLSFKLSTVYQSMSSDNTNGKIVNFFFMTTMIKTSTLINNNDDTKIIFTFQGREEEFLGSL